MSDLLNALQQRHQEKLDQLEHGEVDEALLDEIQLLISDLRQAGAVVASPAERGQLRALMRFWGNVVYDHTGVYPDTMLQPLDPARAPLPAEPTRRPSPPLTWILAGGAAVAIIAAGLVAIGWMVYPRATPVPTESTPILMPPSTPLPFVSQIAVGAALGPTGALEMAADTFCLGTSEVAAEIMLEGSEPETIWRWEVRREGEVVNTQPAAPWGRGTQTVTVRALTGGPEGVEPGQYELLVYAGEQVVGAHSFRVLDVAPRVFNLWVADVPEPAQMVQGENEFEAGVRVIYLGYEYEGMCPGLDLAHALYHQGEPVREILDTWIGDPQGRAQVSFQAPGDSPFRPGDYEVVVMVAGEEQGRVEFTVEEASQGQGEIPPSFGDITIALGVRPDGTPILAARDFRFDWNTKVVYAVFDYMGMRDGLRWAAVWMRNGQEVAREEHPWNVAAMGTEGTHWVTYYDESARTLPGGTYSVTLYINNVAQRTAEFGILYYVPPAE